MKRTDLEKNKGTKIAGNMKLAGIPNRFGKDAGAAQLAYAQGSEFREPRTCELTGTSIKPIGP